MPRATAELWTTSRKMPGNLLPTLLSLPFLVLAVRSASSPNPFPQMWWYGLGFIGVGWISLNLIGLIGNRKLKRTLELRFLANHPGDDRKRTFVGFAKPSYKGLLDPHEDVGFLILGEEDAEFWGSRIEMAVPKEVLTTVRFRPNAHSLLGLGRWVSIEGRQGESEVRLLVEPRERATLLGNRRYSKRLRSEIQAWLETPVANPSRNY